MVAETPLRRPWTLMIYMGGDNGKIFDTKYGRVKLMASMEDAGYADICEMGAVGTTDQCAITCLFDTAEATYLVEVEKVRRFSDNAVQQIAAVNTGDPNVLRDFIIRSVQKYPADHYALVIWNHGTGWLDTDAYASVRSAGDKERPALFRTTQRTMVKEATTRPIAYDDSSKDFLDTQDLRRAFAEARQATGRRLDLIGMDACLMAMIEGARELAPFADYFVASQEVEPMDGWPYQPILAALNAEPGMAPGVLSDRIVREFATSYNAATRSDWATTRAGEETVTLSATALANTAGTEALCRQLVDAILAQDFNATLKTIVRDCLRSALVFQDRNYRDLGDFAARLVKATEFESFPAVTAAAQALNTSLNARTADAPVLRVAFRPRYTGATGLSVYVPPSSLAPDQRERVMAIYRNLLFPQATGWDRLLDWAFSEF